jgi:hypothetical protein
MENYDQDKCQGGDKHCRCAYHRHHGTAIFLAIVILVATFVIGLAVGGHHARYSSNGYGRANYGHEQIGRCPFHNRMMRNYGERQDLPVQGNNGGMMYRGQSGGINQYDYQYQADPGQGVISPAKPAK